MWWEIALEVLLTMGQVVLVGVVVVTALYVAALPLVWVGKYVQNAKIGLALILGYFFILVWLGITTLEFWYRS